MSTRFRQAVDRVAGRHLLASSEEEDFAQDIQNAMKLLKKAFQVLNDATDVAEIRPPMGGESLADANRNVSSVLKHIREFWNKVSPLMRTLEGFRPGRVAVETAQIDKKWRLADSHRSASEELDYYSEVAAIAEEITFRKKRALKELLKGVVSVLKKNGITTKKVHIDMEPFHGRFASVSLDVASAEDVHTEGWVFRGKIDQLLGYGWDVKWSGMGGTLEFTFPPP